MILERDNLEVPKRGSIVSHETFKVYLERCKHNVYIDRLLVLLKERFAKNITYSNILSIFSPNKPGTSDEVAQMYGFNN